MHLVKFKFTLCNGQPVCIQTTHQDTSQIGTITSWLCLNCSIYFKTHIDVFALENNGLEIRYAMANLCAFRRHIRTRARLFHYNFS